MSLASQILFENSMISEVLAMQKLQELEELRSTAANLLDSIDFVAECINSR